MFIAFKGPICAEIGVYMKPNSIKYDFAGNRRSTISEKIRVGFTATNLKEFLLDLFSNFWKIHDYNNFKRRIFTRSI